MKRFSFHTLMRSLAMDYTADKQTYGVGDQFLFGPGLMVCPVYNYKAPAPLERIGKTDAEAKIIRYNGTKTIVKLK